MATVQVGLKKKHMNVPNGWEVVRTGYCRVHDKFANIDRYCWSPVEEDDIGVPADCFDCLIRRRPGEIDSL